jgi:hypothetical protein
MLYKTMVLELIQQRPELHEQLRKDRMLLPMLEFCARRLKASHEARKEVLSQARPGSDPSQIASEALEIALQDLQVCLQAESPPGDSELISLEDAMAFLRKHTPPA